MWKHYMYAIMSDLGKYLVNRYALCLKGLNMPRPPLLISLWNRALAYPRALLHSGGPLSREF